MLLRDILLESFPVSLGNKKFKVLISPNINPTKEGIKIKYIVDSEEELDNSEMGDLSATLQNLTNKALSPYKMSVNIDPDVPEAKHSQVIGLYLAIDQFENFLERALKKILSNTKTPVDAKKKEDTEEDTSD